MASMKMTQPKILIVGGHGFIGKHVAAHALRLGWDVTSLSLQHRQNNGDLKTISADITKFNELEQALHQKKFDYVINCGGYIHHALFSQGGLSSLESHFIGVVNLTQILDRSTLRAFINLGSSDEYGNNPAPQDESQREAPLSPYSLGKTASTHFLQMLHRTENFPAITLRLFLTYGPGQNDERFLPQIIKGCLQDRSFPTSAGEQLRDFCFIKDTVDALFIALDKPAAHGEVINIASGQAVSIRHMIETVRNLIGQGQPQFGKIPYRTGENKALYANISKAYALLGWQPSTSLTEGLQQTINYYRQDQ